METLTISSLTIFIFHTAVTRCNVYLLCARVSSFHLVRKAREGVGSARAHGIGEKERAGEEKGRGKRKEREVRVRTSFRHTQNAGNRSYAVIEDACGDGAGGNEQGFARC